MAADIVLGFEFFDLPSPQSQVSMLKLKAKGICSLNGAKNTRTTYHLSMSSVSQGFSTLKVDGIVGSLLSLTLGGSVADAACWLERS